MPAMLEAGGAGATVAGLPWPEGDAGGLAQAAGQTASAADSLRSSGARLAGAAGGAGGWEGQAAAAFRTAAAEQRGEMVRGAAGLEDAAAALKRLSRVVREAQDLVKELAEEVRDAEEEADRAAARAAVAQTLAAAAGTALALAGPDPPAALARAASETSADAGATSGMAGDARAHAEAVRERNTRKAQDACDEVLREDVSTAAAVDAAASAAPLRGVPIGSPTPAIGFAQVGLSGLSIGQWRQIAYWRAGIDDETWLPSLGLFENDDTVQAVYTYYGSLFSEHPGEFQWAGMAAMMGPMFYGGWQDMYAVRGLSDDGDRARYLSEMVGLPKLPGFAYDVADWAGNSPLTPVGMAEHLTSEELEWYEDRFMEMQKQIFDDLAWQHEAFAMGGVGLMQDVRDRNLISTEALRAWEQIGSGDSEQVFNGNRELLRREQLEIIQDDYDAMREHHGPVGDVATYSFGAMAENAIPGGQAYRDFDPLTVSIGVETPDPFGIDTPDFQHEEQLPLPAGNLSDFDDRWAWIEGDMLPAYRDVLQDPGAVEAIVRADVAQRAEGYRKLPDLPYPGGS
jgi:hypothetical protein